MKAEECKIGELYKSNVNSIEGLLYEVIEKGDTTCTTRLWEGDVPNDIIHSNVPYSCLEKCDHKKPVTYDMKNFAKEYAMWVLLDGQKYLNAASKDFTTDDVMDIFIENYYLKNWLEKDS